MRELTKEDCEAIASDWEAVGEDIRFALSEEDKAIAEKAAKLIARDYGEVLKRLEDE